jgi:signal transduction histidine kinase/DNA-binding NarL/FixJ family response regulator
MALVYGQYLFAIGYLRYFYYSKDQKENRIILVLVCSILIAAFLFTLVPFQLVDIYIKHRVYLIVAYTNEVYTLYLLIVAFVKKKEEALLLLIAHSLCCVAQIPIRSNITDLNYCLSSSGLFILYALISSLLIKRYYKIYKKAQHLSENLIQEVERQTRLLSTQKEQLEKTNNKLVESDQYKTEFFQNITHEFRTPLALILGPADTIIKNCTMSQQLNTLEHAHIIKRNACHMLDMVNQFLDLSKMNAGKMQLNLEWLNFISLCTSISRSFESLAENKNITFATVFPENLVFINSDRDKILRIINNLLSNAFKFTETGGTIELIVKFPYVQEQSTEQKNDFVYIGVKDTGIGISEQDLPYIFERFRQVDGSANRKFGGTGIGLALVKEYVTLLEGKLDVQSIEGKGSEFTVLLPVTISASTAKDAIQHIPVHSESNLQEDLVHRFIPNADQNKISASYNDSVFDPLKKTVFILDDNEELRIFLKKNLEFRYNIFAGVNGKHGLEKIKTLPKIPDVIISDIMMPEMDGFDFYQKLTSNPDFNHIPFIFLTAKTDERINGLSLGAVDFIPKPFDIDEIIQKIESLLKLQIHYDKKVTHKIREQIAVIFRQDEVITDCEALFDERCLRYSITEREKQVIRFIQRGYVDKMIAQELYISKFTVNAHLKNIYKKCNTNTRGELIKKFSEDQ